MNEQITLLTSHKGVDLHAATAVRVMRERLDGGEALVRLSRAECHTFWRSPGDGDNDGPEVARLLESTRYYNPNKHHFGHFALAGAAPWTDADSRGAALPAGWPGTPTASDLPDLGGLYARLLGGEPADGAMAVDVCAWHLGRQERMLSGVVWRLVLRPGQHDPAQLAERLAVARSRELGLLVNPHMEAWRSVVRPA
ncbi:MAG: hypothetical protein R6X25_10070 [Candidatus Krumholzibacteriia bacterium]